VGRLSRCLGLAALLATVTWPARGQVALGLRPLLGYYLPLGRFDHAELLSTALPQQPSDLQGVAWGGDVQVRLRPRVAVEVLGLGTRTTLPSCTCPGGPTAPAPVHVSIAAVEAQLEFSPRPSRYQLWVSGGPAVIRHSGRGYERPPSPVSWGGALGLELGVPVGSHWQVVATGTGIGYHFDLDFPPQHGPQLDAVLAVGLRWHSGS
jgi:hypothetical protein